MLLLKIKPNKKMFLKHSWGTYIFGIILMLFTILWTSIILISFYNQYRLIKHNLASIVLPAVLFMIITVFFCVHGMKFSFGFYKQRNQIWEFENYFVTENNILVISKESEKKVDFNDITEIVVIYSWIYFSKNYGDIYFKCNAKESILPDTLFENRDSIYYKNIKKAVRFIAVESAEETATRIAEAINKSRDKKLSYIIKYR